MRILAASIVIGPLMMIGAVPVVVGQSISSDTHVQRTATAASPGDRDTYTHEARHDMQEWQRKLHDVGENAEAKGKAAGDATRNDLNAAWTKADAASRALATASANGWDRAKISYEKATHELANAWDRFQSPAK